MRRSRSSGVGCFLAILALVAIAYFPALLLLIPVASLLYFGSKRAGRGAGGSGRGSYGGGYGGQSYGAQRDPILVLLAAMMKADGQIMRSELDFVKGILHELYPSHVQEALLSLRDILKGPIDVSGACAHIRMRFGVGERMQILRILYDLAQADGNVHPAERALLEQIAMGLGLDTGQYNRQRASYVKETPDYYAVLGLSSSASNSEVRAAYKRLALQWHPDRFSGQGDRAIEEASERFKKINEAYDAIRKLRGLN